MHFTNPSAASRGTVISRNGFRNLAEIWPKYQEMANSDYYLNFFDSWIANLLFQYAQSYLLPDFQHTQ